MAFQRQKEDRRPPIPVRFGGVPGPTITTKIASFSIRLMYMRTAPEALMSFLGLAVTVALVLWVCRPPHEPGAITGARLSGRNGAV